MIKLVPSGANISQKDLHHCSLEALPSFLCSGTDGTVLHIIRMHRTDLRGFDTPKLIKYEVIKMRLFGLHN